MAELTTSDVRHRRGGAAVRPRTWSTAASAPRRRRAARPSTAGGTCGCSAVRARRPRPPRCARPCASATPRRPSRPPTRPRPPAAAGPTPPPHRRAGRAVRRRPVRRRRARRAADTALLASLGCGDPTAMADLREGETVLDLGSGGGIDVLLSARRVGPTGTAYGLDMTDEMLELARANQAEAGVGNVHWLKGHIEAMPLPDASVDVVLSNCVINLSADKHRSAPRSRARPASPVDASPSPTSSPIPTWTPPPAPTCSSDRLHRRRPHRDEFATALHGAGLDASRSPDAPRSRARQLGDLRARKPRPRATTHGQTSVPPAPAQNDDRRRGMLNGTRPTSAPEHIVGPGRSSSEPTTSTSPSVRLDVLQRVLPSLRAADHGLAVLPVPPGELADPAWARCLLQGRGLSPPAR